MSAIRRVDVPVEGGTLAAFRLGSGPDGADPVLSVHGITANSRAWLPVARSLDGAATLLAVDLRGRGASSALPPPYGMEAYTRDMLAVLDRFEIQRAVLVGHSLGAYAVARFAADRPERVRAAVLVDGGLTLPGIENVDPAAFVEAFLGPTLARLELEFGTHEEYHGWWRSHPAFATADVAEEDLVAYADHDLGGEAPNPMIPSELAATWADAAPGQRRVGEVADVNHYTIVMGATGARAVAQAIVRAVATPPADPPLRSAR